MALDFLTRTKLETGFGTDIVNATSYEDVLYQAGLDWTVEACKTYTELNGTSIEIPKTNTIVRVEDGQPLGIVSDKYKLVQNKDAFAFTELIFNTKNIQFVKGGVYKGGSATWLQAKLEGDYSILGDKAECSLVFFNSHNGKGSIRTLIFPYRLACANALNLPIKSAARNWRCVHTGDPNKKIKEAQEVLCAGSTYMEAIKREAEYLQQIKLTNAQIDNFTARLFPITDDMTDRQKDNQMLRREQLIQVYVEKDDLQNFGPTGYKYISAVVDYIDHVEGKNTKTANVNRFISVACGNPFVDKAYDMVISA